jgi:protein-S-isoprenylcysteine O-methyltransferase Ste14
MTRIPALGSRGEGWVVLQLLLLAAIGVAGLAGLANPWWDGPVRIVASGAGLALGVAGAWQAGRGLRDLGANLTPLPHPTAAAQLVETGIYRRVRHPIYGGSILMALGWSLLAASVPALGLAGLLVPFFWLKSSVEERWLEGRFAGYPAYRRRTRRFIAWPG